MQQLQLPPLAEGELYIGAIGDKTGDVYHVILLPGDSDDATFKKQLEWAKSIGGDLPNRIEQAMLFANFRDQFERDAYWSNTPDTDPGYSGWAWYQGFDGGFQLSYHTGTMLRARAVRRLPI
ncbi:MULTISPECIES: Lcl C-terminal domain-containing protein [Paraburkholderia]|uniref:DUF1566 domain-containing protein n=1 Tax=Paraburkholderia TaxID=1822464 RepID=UPI00224F143A|nr:MULTISPECIES: DUF1566 domain-containing protein [Paraburkholderia]MCX4154960.1 DUF1566 domain-containing protein [Paraburkholderia aspalathi]MDN7164372.1 DUF1566 domain-containing protein [Paraburkholderia sp. SECH2]MDQ6392857.1 DUF1566 domain-containing protein [Paraburkholderia aspalathi]